MHLVIMLNREIVIKLNMHYNIISFETLCASKIKAECEKEMRMQYWIRIQRHWYLVSNLECAIFTSDYERQMKKMEKNENEKEI